MELLGFLLVLTAIAEKVGQAIGWCLVTLVRGYAILLMAIVRFIISEIQRRNQASTEEKTSSSTTTINPNIDDAVAGLKKLGLPQGAAQKFINELAAANPAASAGDMIKAALQQMDKR